jgi:putative ABC transport system permease protein
MMKRFSRRLSTRIGALIQRADLALAMRNVFRQKARTAMTLAIIGAGVAGLILSGGFVEQSLVTLRETTIHAQLGHLQIYRKGYFAEGKRSPYKYLIEDPAQIIGIAAAMPQVRRTMSRLSFAGVLNNGKTDYAIFGEGIEPAKEAEMGTQIQLVEGHALGPDDRFGVMIGEGVASGMGLHPGDTVNLLLNTEEGALNNLEFTIGGVFRTFSKDYDAHAVRIALPDAQELLASKAINAVVVELKRTSDTEQAAAALIARLDPAVFEVKTWHDLADVYEQTAELFKRQFAFLQAVILLSVLLSVANSVNMTIFERTGEFGTLLALGTRRRAIFRLVLTENMLVGTIGSALGVLLGVLLGGVINGLHITLPPPPNSNAGYYAGILLTPGIVIASFVVGAVATPLTALLPARRISRVPVVDALRMN